ncbi:MAG: MptD family putative ECF transporter S component [Muribaculaceae bacterium]|nr:MptD family putative ECF transporter S component [Muribaculaceae bacterium]
MALLYVLAFVIVEVLGAMHPYVWTYSAVPAALVAAWPYYKLCQRYPLPGMAMLCALMLLMLNFLFGQGHEIFALGCIILGFIAEGFRKFLGNCRGRLGTIASYATMSLIPFTKTCVWWVNFDLANNMTIYNKQDIYYATLGRMLNFQVLTVMVILTLVLAIASMWLLTRHWRPRERYHVIIEK